MGIEQKRFIAQWGDAQHAMDAINSGNDDLEDHGYRNVMVPKEQMDKAVHDHALHRALAENPTLGEAHIRLMIHSNPGIIRELAYHPNIPDDVIDSAVRSSDPTIVRRFATSWRLNDDQMMHIATHPDPVVQGAVVFNPMLKKKHLEAIANSPVALASTSRVVLDRLKDGSYQKDE